MYIVLVKKSFLYFDFFFYLSRFLEVILVNKIASVVQSRFSDALFINSVGTWCSLREIWSNISDRVSALLVYRWWDAVWSLSFMRPSGEFSIPNLFWHFLGYDSPSLTEGSGTSGSSIVNALWNFAFSSSYTSSSVSTTFPSELFHKCTLDLPTVFYHTSLGSPFTSWCDHFWFSYIFQVQSDVCLLCLFHGVFPCFIYLPLNHSFNLFFSLLFPTAGTVHTSLRPCSWSHRIFYSIALHLTFGIRLPIGLKAGI